MAWEQFEHGTTIGQRGSEHGIIVRDDEYQQQARITLERDGMAAPFTITCGIYGWMFHTCFFATRVQADTTYDQMRDALAAIVEHMTRTNDPHQDENSQAVTAAITQFVEQFP